MHAYVLSAVALAATIGALDAVAVPDPATATITVYRCRSGEQTVFADRPCGEHAEPVDVAADGVNTYTPAPNVGIRAPNPHPLRERARASGASAPRLERKRQLCSGLARDIRRIHAHMRGGYRAREGEKLKERLRRAKNDYRDRCG